MNLNRVYDMAPAPEGCYAGGEEKPSHIGRLMAHTLFTGMLEKIERRD